MKCANIKQATAVAMATMAKMSEQDYTLFAPFADSVDWHIAKTSDADETFYTLNPTGEGFTCTCPFYGENDICKHGLYVQKEIAFRAWVAETETLLQEFDRYGEEH